MSSSASFSLDDYSFDKATIDFTNSNSKKLTIEFIPSGVFEKKEENSIYNLKFLFTAKCRETQSMIVSLECNAIFKFKNVESLESIPSYFYVNSIAILFPYVRAFVSTITLQSNNGPIVLPTLNLSDLEQELRNNTIEK